MPRHKKDLHDWPSLNVWLYGIGLTNNQIREHTYYSALVDYFPGSKGGSHLIPTSQEIQKEHSRLVKTIQDFDPQIVVCIGKLSIANCLGLKSINLAETIGKIYSVDPYGSLGRKIMVIPLPHPSGASTWRHKPANMILLTKALKLLKSQLKL